MKLNQFNRNVMTSGGETTQFTATMNGAAFAILSDGIYEHKPAAIVRETCCNAYDSHIEAGREEVPFKVQLPNQFSPYLIVEDTGIGLDDDGVRKVFASYFNSTKNATDDVTGGFGIGAKSLFSYTDAFEIVAKKDGVRRDYTAFIGDDGIPNVQLVDESETTDHNGVSIRMPVRASDFKKFENEARVVCSFFKVKPEVTGVKDFEFEVDDVYQQIEDNGFASMGEYTSSSLYNDRFYALMNNVIYPIPRTVVHQVDSEVFGMLRILGNNRALIIPFANGELAPAASRETLSLN